MQYNVPEPVGRYLSRVLGASPPAIRVAAITQRGTLRTGPRSTRWLDFNAEQTSGVAWTGFVWRARVRVAPLIYLQVRDSLTAGSSSGRVSFLNITVAADYGSREFNAAAMQRYLGEAVWYPTALIPSARLSWSALGSRKAVATLTDLGITVALQFHFNDADEVSAVYTPARWRKVRNGYLQQPWEGRFASYERRNAVLVPLVAMAGWHTDGSWTPAWNGEIRRIAYEA
jgi:uncharacterized protein DUF6920